MLNRIVTFALTQRLMILGGALVILIWGLFALRELPIQAFPDVQDVQVQVITQLPGQAPPEVERMVTLPIEREMNGIPGLPQARSISMMGLSVITMTFADGVEDHFARQQVIEKLSNASLPPGIQPDLAPLTTGVGEIYRYVVKAPPTMSIEDVRVLEDWVIRPAIRSVAGIADVVSFGGTIKEYQVAVNTEKLRRFNVTLTQVSHALQNNSTNAGGGIMRRGDEALVMRGLGDPSLSISRVYRHACLGRVRESDFARRDRFRYTCRQRCGAGGGADGAPRTGRGRSPSGPGQGGMALACPAHYLGLGRQTRAVCQGHYHFGLFTYLHLSTGRGENIFTHGLHLELCNFGRDPRDLDPHPGLAELHTQERSHEGAPQPLDAQAATVLSARDPQGDHTSQGGVRPLLAAGGDQPRAGASTRYGIFAQA